jgi:hypothetical protein
MEVQSRAASLTGCASVAVVIEPLWPEFGRKRNKMPVKGFILAEPRCKNYW